MQPRKSHTEDGGNSTDWAVGGGIEDGVMGARNTTAGVDIEGH